MKRRENTPTSILITKDLDGTYTMLYEDAARTPHNIFMIPPEVITAAFYMILQLQKEYSLDGYQKAIGDT